MPRPCANAFDAMLDLARTLDGVTEGTSCTQTSFKVGTTAFLYLSDQGGRHKVMLKLDASLDAALDLADAQPDDCQVGKTRWVTLRFADTAPIPKRTWTKWIKESHALAGG